jgi:23S rRNA-/tRNA-specific pseudouridylate synthase
MFKKREILKKYWVITKGIPNPAEGKLNIPKNL